MPKNGSIGLSENTPLKQDHFRTIVKTHMSIVRSIIGRKDWVFPRYIYMDFNAGAGRYGDAHGYEMIGSPLIALGIAEQLGLPLWGCLCEADKITMQSLRRTLSQWGLQDQGDEFVLGETWLWLYGGSYVLGVPEFVTALSHTAGQQHYYGMLYSDENGALPPFALMGTCASQLPYCDILIHVAATPIKRQFYSPVHPLMQRLDALMATVPKDYWVVREPYGRHQWTFLIGTNWESFPKFRKQGFWPITSPEGASILRRLSLNREEYSGQGTLFSS